MAINKIKLANRFQIEVKRKHASTFPPTLTSAVFLSRNTGRIRNTDRTYGQINRRVHRGANKSLLHSLCQTLSTWSGRKSGNASEKAWHMNDHANASLRIPVRVKYPWPEAR